MTSGRDALHRIDGAIAEARRRLARAGDAAAADGKRLADIDARRVEAFRALADARISLLKSGGAASLGAADRKARELIAVHEAAISALAARRSDASKAVERLEADRRDAESARDESVARHETAVAATRARLDGDAEYDRRAQAVEAGDAVAKRAAQKLELARADRAAKGAPYEADPLFMYLVRRKFATRDYRAFPLFALLDRWIAGLVKYRAAKLNYDRLTELPERLAEHAARVEKEAAGLAELLEAYERAALEKDGVGALRDAAAAAGARLEALDKAIEEAEGRQAAADAEFNETAAGRAGPLEEARRVLADALDDRSIPDLKVLAAETETRDDDSIVSELIGLKREAMELEEARDAEARSLESGRGRLSDLEDIRRRFKQARFDSPYSEFPGEDLIGALIVEFLRGSLARDDFWRRIERGHRARRRHWDDDFGGDSWRDGLRLPRRHGEGSGWPLPGPMSPGPTLPGPSFPSRTVRVPRIPSGGGFRTGGGFRGGGGFKTGGGF